jgi:oxygen-independent coproporphyrinogen-3 oxidase
VPAAREREHAFVDALVDEMGVALSALGAKVDLRTVFVGGGTPTVLAVSEWERVAAAIAPYVPGGGVPEFTVEMNPEDVTADMVRFLHGLGVNRASLGIQSMHDVGQKVLKRCAPAVNERAIDIVRSQWDNVSFDVLLGVPKATIDDLRATLRFLAAKEPRHLSVYGLEPGGDLGEEVERFFRAVDPDRVADEYLETCGFLAGAGYHHYEVSNFARPGFESAHNRVYWDGGDYLGLGPAAHSSIGGVRFANAPSIDAYVARRGWEHVEARIRDEGGDGRMESIMLDLRTDRGVALADCDGSAIREFVADGLAVVDGGRARLTDRGYLLLNDVVLRLVVRMPC